MTEKFIISHKEQINLQNDIIRQMTKDGYVPDVIVGVSRGGLPIGVMLSHYYDIPFAPFKGSIRDHPNWETDWKLPSHWQIKNGSKNILIVDDICDEGDTIKKIKHDISKQFNILVAEDSTGDGETIKKIRKDVAKAYPKANIKTCALVQNVNKVFTVDYYGVTINKKEKPCWVIFPIEEWWKQ